MLFPIVCVQMVPLCWCLVVWRPAWRLYLKPHSELRFQLEDERIRVAGASFPFDPIRLASRTNLIHYSCWSVTNFCSATLANKVQWELTSFDIVDAPTTLRWTGPNSYLQSIPHCVCDQYFIIILHSHTRTFPSQLIFCWLNLKTPCGSCSNRSSELCGSRVDSILHLHFYVPKICATEDDWFQVWQNSKEHEPRHRQMTRFVPDGPIHSETNSLQSTDERYGRNYLSLQSNSADRTSLIASSRSLSQSRFFPRFKLYLGNIPIINGVPQRIIFQTWVLCSCLTQIQIFDNERPSSSQAVICRNLDSVRYIVQFTETVLSIMTRTRWTICHLCYHRRLHVCFCWIKFFMNLVFFVHLSNIVFLQTCVLHRHQASELPPLPANLVDTSPCLLRHSSKQWVHLVLIIFLNMWLHVCLLFAGATLFQSSSTVPSDTNENCTQLRTILNFQRCFYLLQIWSPTSNLRTRVCLWLLGLHVRHDHVPCCQHDQMPSFDREAHDKNQKIHTSSWRRLQCTTGTWSRNRMHKCWQIHTQRGKRKRWLDETLADVTRIHSTRHDVQENTSETNGLRISKR